MRDKKECWNVGSERRRRLRKGEREENERAKQRRSEEKKTDCVS